MIQRDLSNAQRVGIVTERPARDFTDSEAAEHGLSDWVSVNDLQKPVRRVRIG